MKPKISIIIPVYNVETYIRECLDSIIKQTFTQWECLLIDDGSPDKSGAICDEYVKLDSRFKVYHKHNGGVSSARNYGLEKAQGEWVTFIDSDDFISPTFLEGLYKPLTRGEKLDFVHGGCTNWENGKIAGINQQYEDYVGADSVKLFKEYRGLIVSKLFRLEIINQSNNGFPLRFDERMRIAEDMLFTTDYLLWIKKYALVSEVGYYYRKDNLGSATKRIRGKCFEEEYYKFCRIYESYYNYIQVKSLTIDQSIYRHKILASILVNVLFSLYPSEKREKRLRKLKCILPSQLFLLNYYDDNLLKKKLVKLIYQRRYVLFDLIVSLIYKAK